MLKNVILILDIIGQNVDICWKNVAGQTFNHEPDQETSITEDINLFYFLFLLKKIIPERRKYLLKQLFIVNSMEVCRYDLNIFIFQNASLQYKKRV